MTSTLEAGEEQWQGAFESLCARFPTVVDTRVAQALRDHNGHAGYAASELRELSDVSVKDASFDDKEHVATLLSSPPMFKHACDEHFKKFDANKNGSLEFDEVVALTNSLYDTFGLQPPSDETLLAFFTKSDTNKDGSLSESEFRKFFESFLRHAFFDTNKLRKIVEDSSSKGRVAPKCGGA